MIRNDFVSNSSSSSFIIANNFLFVHFNITKNIVQKTIKKLTGVDFDIYDMTNTKERKKCLKEYSDLFSDWDGIYCEGYDAYKEFIKSLEKIGIYDYEIKCDDGTYFDHKLKKDLPIPEHIIQTNKFLREKLNIYTMLEYAKDKNTIIVIHFGDNDVWSIKGINECGKADIHSYSSKKTVEEAKNTPWVSQQYSRERFYEVLIRQWIQDGIINLQDEKFMSYWLVPEDHWWKNDQFHKDHKYFTNDHETVTVTDILDDIIDCCDQSVLHEG